MKILYVEGNKYLGEVVKLYLEEMRHEVIMVTKVSEAIEALSASQFDKIICERTLDRNNRGEGVKFAAQLQKEGKNVVVFTSDTRFLPEDLKVVRKNFELESRELIRQVLEY